MNFIKYISIAFSLLFISCSQKNRVDIHQLNPVVLSERNYIHLINPYECYRCVPEIRHVLKERVLKDSTMMKQSFFVMPYLRQLEKARLIDGLLTGIDTAQLVFNDSLYDHLMKVSGMLHTSVIIVDSKGAIQFKSTYQDWLKNEGSNNSAIEVKVINKYAFAEATMYK